MFHTSKIEEPILSIFVSYSYFHIAAHTLLLLDPYFLIVARKKFDNQTLITEFEKIFSWINDLKNIIAYFEEYKQSEALPDKCGSFYTANIDGGSGGEQGSYSKILPFIPSFKFGRTVFPVFKLTQICDLHYSIKIFS